DEMTLPARRGRRRPEISEVLRARAERAAPARHTGDAGSYARTPGAGSADGACRPVRGVRTRVPRRVARSIARRSRRRVRRAARRERAATRGPPSLVATVGEDDLPASVAGP